MIRIGDKKITQATIAKELNLSIKTVGRVFQNAPGVSEATRKTVLDKAHELGISSSLQKLEQNVRDSHAHREIAFIGHTDYPSVQFWMNIVKGSEQYLSRQNIILRFVFVNFEQEKSLTLPKTLEIPGLSGIIITSSFSDDYYRLIQSLGLPIVSYDIPVKNECDLYKNPNIDIVIPEGRNSTSALTNLMIEKGYKRLAFVGNYMTRKSFYERYQGYLDALNSHGLTPILLPSLLKFIPDISSEENIKNIHSELLALDALPDAYVCINDDLASLLIRILRNDNAINLDKIKIAGFDNLSGFESAWDWKQIPQFFGTVNIDCESIGEILARQLLLRIENQNIPHMFLTVETIPIFADTN